jgi:hypothetical protein
MIIYPKMAKVLINFAINSDLIFLFTERWLGIKRKERKEKLVASVSHTPKGESTG